MVLSKTRTNYHTPFNLILAYQNRDWCFGIWFLNLLLYDNIYVSFVPVKCQKRATEWENERMDVTVYTRDVNKRWNNEKQNSKWDQTENGIERYRIDTTFIFIRNLWKLKTTILKLSEICVLFGHIKNKWINTMMRCTVISVIYTFYSPLLIHVQCILYKFPTIQPEFGGEYYSLNK